MTVTFTPTAATSYSGTVTVNSDATSGTNTIAASRTGTAAPTPIIGVSGNLAFGSVLVGNTAQRAMTVANTGSTNLTVSSISYPPGFSGLFSGTIVDRGFHQRDVTFAPTAVTNYPARRRRQAMQPVAPTPWLFRDRPAATRIIGLSGSLAFGSVQVGNNAQRTLTIANTGNTNLTVSSISYPPASVARSAVPSRRRSTNVTVTFTPTTVTNYSGTVTVTSDATSGANTIAASGTGTAVPTRIIGVSGNLAFGSVQVGHSPPNDR